MCVMTSELCDWHLRDIAKIEQKAPNDNKVCNLFFNILTRFRLLLPHMRVFPSG